MLKFLKISVIIHISVFIMLLTAYAALSNTECAIDWLCIDVNLHDSALAIIKATTTI